MWLVDRQLPGPVLLSGGARWLGLLPIILGLALGLWGIACFRRARTSPIPFAEPSAVVTDGPYRFTRNPMYLGLVLLLLGWAMLLGSTLPFLLVPLFLLVIDRRFVRREEPFLAERLGPAYDAYRQRVRRWL